MPAKRRPVMKLSVTDLALEITRRCNMRCEHCLRGDAEGIDMTKQAMESVFAATEEIMTLTFTGGEPSLAPDLIRYALTCARKYKTKVHEVYLATNGLQVPEKFLLALRAWHMYCLSCEASCPEKYTSTNGIRRIVDARNAYEATGVFVDISMDRFHDDIPVENVLRLCALPNIRTDKYRDPNDDGWVLNVGKAYWNGIGEPGAGSDRPWAYGETSGILDIRLDHRGLASYDGMIYVNACGQVLKYCDYPYEEQDEHVLGEIDPVQFDPAWVERLYEAHKNDKESE